jgi:hypothetical protein
MSGKIAEVTNSSSFPVKTSHNWSSILEMASLDPVVVLGGCGGLGHHIVKKLFEVGSTTVPVHPTRAVGQRAEHHLCDTFSSQHNTTTMTGIDEAVAEAKSTPLGEKIPWTTIARKHGVVRSTLTRKVERGTRSHQEDAVMRQNLSL